MSMMYRNKAKMPAWCEKSDPTATEPAKQRGLPDVKVLDDYELQLTYTQSRVDLIPWLALKDDSYLLLPSAYLKQFHLAYTEPDEIMQSITTCYPEAQSRPSTPTWEVLNEVVSQTWIPTLAPWMATDKADTIVRNPYYFKVDREGQQLPYTDILRVGVEYGMYIPPDPLHFNKTYSYFNLPKGKQVEDAMAYALEKNQTLYSNFVSDGSWGGMYFILDSDEPWWLDMVNKVDFDKHYVMRWIPRH